MGGAALQQWSPTLYGAKAGYGVQDWFVGYTAVFFVTGPVCKFPTQMMKLGNRLGLVAALARGSGIELLKPTLDDLLQMCPVSKRVNSSRADDSDSALIEKSNWLSLE
jgi:hypothetical protein